MISSFICIFALLCCVAGYFKLCDTIDRLNDWLAFIYSEKSEDGKLVCGRQE